MLGSGCAVHELALITYTSFSMRVITDLGVCVSCVSSEITAPETGRLIVLFINSCWIIRVIFVALYPICE